MTMKQLSVPKPQISSRRDVDDGLKSVASVEEAVELTTSKKCVNEVALTYTSLRPSERKLTGTSVTV